MDKLSALLDWYKGCDVCDETLANVNSELATLGLVAHFDHDIIVVRAEPKAMKPKPAKVEREAVVSKLPVPRRRAPIPPSGNDLIIPISAVANDTLRGGHVGEVA